MNIDGADLIIYGPGRTSLSVLVRSWLDDALLIGTAASPDVPMPISMSIRMATSPDAEAAARDGFSVFRTQIGDEQEREGSLTSTVTGLPDGEFRLHDFHATLGNFQYRALAIEDPFPILIPIVVGIVAVSSVVGQKIAMKEYQQLANNCMAKGGSPKIVDQRGATVTFDGRIKARLKGRTTFRCDMPQTQP